MNRETKRLVGCYVGYRSSKSFKNLCENISHIDDNPTHCYFHIFFSCDTIKSMDVGIDIIEICRIRKIVHRNRFFLETVFSKRELEQLRLKKDVYSSVSSRFSAKESFFKCIGGIKYLDSLRLVEIISDDLGRPAIVLNDYLASKFKNYEFSVSTSHCKNYACSVVIKKQIVRSKLENK